MTTPALDDLRRRVRGTLEGNPSYRSLPADKRAALARDLVDTLAYLSDPSAGDDSLVGVDRGGPVALAEEPAPPAPPPGPQKQSVTGAATQTATQAFRDLVGAVDFPGFVSSLMQGVFTSIVDSSIRQMEAYADLLAATVKSVDSFAKENFTDNQARDWLRDQHPSALEVDTSGGSPRLRRRRGGEEEEDGEPTDLGRTVGAAPGEQLSVDDAESEQELVRRAKLKMARARQQQLATMVVLGINRIVVTDGRINAKVVFDVKSEETSAFKSTAAFHDEKKALETGVEHNRSFWGTTGKSSTRVNTRVTTLDVNTTQEANERVEAKAKLTGEVTVNFKSETFPLEKLASPDQLLTVNSLSEKPGA